MNQLAGNLTDQVRNIAQVTTAVARGDLSQKITVDARGEILELKNTVNTMVDQLRSLADEVTRVAREVGTEGTLGGPGGAGRRRDVAGPDREREPAGFHADHAAARDLGGVHRRGQRRPVPADHRGGPRRDRRPQGHDQPDDRGPAHDDRANAQQGWLDSNLARIGGLLQGQRDLGEVCSMIMDEVARWWTPRSARSS